MSLAEMVKKTNHRLFHFIMCTLIICALSVDAMMYIVSSFDIESTEDDIVMEIHELEKAYADGQFGGENSHSEQPDYGYIDTPSPGKSINIYEIVPEYGNGQFGYLVGGSEPICPPVSAFDNTKIEEYKEKAKEYMDAVVNLYPGKTSGNGDEAFNFTQIDNEGVRHFGYFKDETVEGYYERVSEGGLFSYVSATGSSSSITNVEMKSKATGDDANYNFRWHYGAPPDKTKIFNDAKNINKMSVGQVIYLNNTKRNQYANNETFLTMFYSEGKPDKNTDGSGKLLHAKVEGIERFVDGKNGQYEINNNDKERYITKKNTNSNGVDIINIVDSWKQSNGVNVFVRTPKDLKEEDIDNADILIFSPKAKGDAVTIYNRLNGTNHSSNNYSSDNDISFDMVTKIYDRVVNKQDLIIAMCKSSFSTLKDNNMNIGKLQWMLYSLKGNDNHWGSGREFFNEIIGSLNVTNAFDYVEIIEDSVKHKKDNMQWKDSWNTWWRINDYDNDFYPCFLKDIPHNTNVTGFDNDPGKGRYKNMMIFESDTQFNYSNYSAKMFREMFMDHVEASHSETANKAYYLSMDILNGDSREAGSISDAKNKVLYVNEYELEPINPVYRVEEKKYTSVIPIHIRVYSSLDLNSLEVSIKEDSDTIINADSEENLTKYLPMDFRFSPDLKSFIDKDNNSVSVETTRYEDLKRNDEGKEVETIEIPCSKLKNSSGTNYRKNTTVEVTVTDKKGHSATDSIKIVKRDFFMLN